MVRRLHNKILRGIENIMFQQSLQPRTTSLQTQLLGRRNCPLGTVMFGQQPAVPLVTAAQSIKRCSDIIKCPRNSGQTGARSVVDCRPIYISQGNPRQLTIVTMSITKKKQINKLFTRKVFQLTCAHTKISPITYHLII